MTYLPNAKGRAAAASAIASADADANANAAAAVPCVSLLLAPLVAATVDDAIKVILLPPPPLTPRMPHLLPLGRRRRRGRKSGCHAAPQLLTPATSQP